MGRTAEGRSELAELADDSASSAADATIPPSPREARSMTAGDKACLCASKVEKQWPWELGCAQARPPKNIISTNRIGAVPGDT